MVGVRLPLGRGDGTEISGEETGNQRVVSSKWFEPRGISSSYCVIVWVRVVLKRTVVGD